MISVCTVHMSFSSTNLKWAAVVVSEGRLLLFLKMRIAEDIRPVLGAFVGGSFTGPVVFRK